MDWKLFLRTKLAMSAVILFAIALLATMSIITNLWVTAGVFVVGLVISIILSKKMTNSTKKALSENVFIILTGSTALMIIALIIYLLLHIFMLGKGSLSWDFIFTAPSEGLTGGGIFPAIVGTALLVIIMSIAGVPIGTITAIYLTEYAKEKSVIARIIRFAVNTLAGVPAIVFGLFGLGFFIGFVGRGIDSVEMNRRMNTLTEIFNSQSSPFNDDGKSTGSDVKKLLEKNDAKYWKEQIEQAKILDEMYTQTGLVDKQTVLKFFKERSRPHWGQPALIWAALTMALLTLPVVIVSVEEAIRTVPKDLREASLALGATKFETILRVVLPGSITGIFTGGILAVSRGAGEVAPILFTGAAYYLPDLPNTLTSQFMELGYHIYVLTTQSTNVDQTAPLQYATTLVLLILTFTLNFSAIFLRSRIRAKMARLQ